MSVSEERLRQDRILAEHVLDQDRSKIYSTFDAVPVDECTASHNRNMDPAHTLDLIAEVRRLRTVNAVLQSQKEQLRKRVAELEARPTRRPGVNNAR